LRSGPFLPSEIFLEFLDTLRLRLIATSLGEILMGVGHLNLNRQVLYDGVHPLLFVAGLVAG
jgi:hypothetical protein